MAHTCNPSAEEAVTGRILGFAGQLANPTWQIPGHQETQLMDGWTDRRTERCVGGWVDDIDVCQVKRCLRNDNGDWTLGSIHMSTRLHTHTRTSIHLLKSKPYHIFLLSKVLSPPHLRRTQAKLLSQVFNNLQPSSSCLWPYLHIYCAPPYSRYMSLKLKLSDPSLVLVTEYIQGLEDGSGRKVLVQQGHTDLSSKP